MKSSRLDRHSTLRTTFRLIAASCLIILISVAASRIEANPSSSEGGFKVTTVFLVRHAEKAATPPEDPPLTEAGVMRSQQLARMLERAGVKAIYTSQFLRTKQTAEPLAKSLGLTPDLLPIEMNPSKRGEVSERSIKQITEKIHERAGEAALVVGHSNTIPQVIKMLGGDVDAAIDEKEFNDLFIVTVLDKGRAKVARLKYGCP